MTRFILKSIDEGKIFIVFFFLGVAELFSIPAGIYVAYETKSLFHGLASFFVPLYGIIYTACHYLL